MAARTKVNLSDFSQGVGTTADTILSAYFPRNFLLIKNEGPGTCAINLTGGTPALATRGSIQLTTGQKLIFQKAVPQNAITAISASTSQLTVLADDSITLPSFLGSPTPLIDTNFMTGQYWVSPLTVTSPAGFLTVSRASTNDMAVDASGVWSSFPANTARVTNLGDLCEESRVNSIRNNSMQNAVPGSPGTVPTNWQVSNFAALNQTIIGVAAPMGVDCIDFRFFGNSISSVIAIDPEPPTQIVAAVGQTWACSGFLALTGGTLTNVTSIQFQIIWNTGAGAFISSTDSADLSASLTETIQRFSVIGTAPATTGFVQLRIKIVVVNPAAVDFTLRFGWPQLEQGASFTSPIRTISAAVTRAADVTNFTAGFAPGASYTMYIQGTANVPTNVGASKTMGQIDDGSNNNRLAFFVNTARAPRGLLASGGVTQSNMTTGSLTEGVRGRLAESVVSGSQIYAFNGTAVTDTAATLPVTPSRIAVGSDATPTAWWNGTIERIIVYNTTQSSAFLTSLTSP